MLADGLSYLRCPHCRAGLAPAGPRLRCDNGHSYDVARQGYVALAAGDLGAAAGDDAGMVAAREAFLASGHFAPLIEAVAEDAWAVATTSGCVVDLGAGVGAQLAAVLERLPDRVGIALDASRPALKRAARAHPRIAAVRCDVWGELPLRDGVASLALSVFAPRNGAEVARGLAPGGAMLVATPRPEHLGELVSGLGLLNVDPDKDERRDRALEPFLDHAGERSLRWSMTLARREARALAAMGPSARHIGFAQLDERVAALGEPVAVTGSVTLSRWLRRGRSTVAL